MTGPFTAPGAPVTRPRCIVVDPAPDDGGEDAEHAARRRPVPTDAAAAMRSVRPEPCRARAPMARNDQLMSIGRAHPPNWFHYPRNAAYGVPMPSLSGLASHNTPLTFAHLALHA